MNAAQTLSRTRKNGASGEICKRYALPFAAILLVLSLSLLFPRFATYANLSNIARNAAYLTIISGGQMIVMILGGLDLSVGVVVAIASVATAITMGATAAAGFSEAAAITLGIISALAISIGVGAANGMLIFRFRVSAFMVTLGAFSVIGGIAYYWTSGIPIYGMPAAFTKGFGRGAWLGLPLPVYVAILLVIVGAFVQRRTIYGTRFAAVGGNAAAARASGVPIDRYVVAGYVLCSLMAGIVGVLLTARIGSGQANIGSEFVLQSVGAAVIAGVSLRGGKGAIENVAFSAILLTLLGNGMNLAGIDSKLQPLAFGALLVVAVLLQRRNTDE